MPKITRNVLGEEVTVYWNYRVMERVDNAGTDYEETNFYIVEMYYDEEDKLIGWSTKETVYGESVDSLRDVLSWMMLALDKETLNEEELLAKAAEARETGESDIFSTETYEPGERLSMAEVLDSLGLEQEDVAPPKATDLGPFGMPYYNKYGKIK